MQPRHAREDGATAAEYAIVAGLIAAVITVSVAASGQAVVGLFHEDEVTSALVNED